MPLTASAPHTPTHPPPASPDLALAEAPVKASGGRGFPSPEDQVKNSPSQSAEKVARRKGRASTSTPSGKARRASPDGVSPAPRRASFSLSFTPIRPIADKGDFDTAASSPAVLARQQQEFQEAMQTSNSKAHAYVAPHRRSLSSSTTTPSSYSPKSLSYYDRSGLPPAEDSYYSSSPSYSGSRSSSAYASARASFCSVATSASPHVVATTNVSPSPTHTHKSRSSSGSWKYANEFPPPASAAAIISRGPYEDPDRHPHPIAIPESEELESNDASSWADEVEKYERAAAYEEEEAEYEPHPSEWSRRPSLADGEELEFLVRIGKRKGSSAFMSSSGIDVPSPVWEEHFDEEDLRMPTSASVTRKVDIPKSRKVFIGPATIVNSEETDENVCTGCGTPPVPSFVALVPCDHLVCHTCLNALINAAAHKPPRPMACFACGSHVDSFLPAWEGVGAAAGGRIGLVEALQESLRNGEGRKPIATDPIAPPVERRSERRSRRSISAATVTLATAMKIEEGKENVPDVAEGGGKAKNRNRSSSASSVVSVVGHGAHLLSPLSLKSKKSRSVLATGSLSQVEYETSTPASPRRSRSESTTSNASKPAGPSTPPRAPLMSRTNSLSLSRSRRNSRSSHSPSHARYGTDETDPATPDLSNSFTPYKIVETLKSGPQTPVAFGGGSEAQVMGSGGVEWCVQEGVVKSSRSVNVDVNTHAEPPAPIDWPVVRLDNIPWDITVAEVEDWLPAETLAPIEQCVMAVHILCNRSDGRTLNQCYVEAASVAAARTIVRSRDGKKMRHRPVHVTLSSQGEFLNTIFPTYEPGFVGLQANKCITPCPLLMQTELTGLLSLCKLESPHAAKIKERPYFNIISILQKFPWYQPETWNSQQIVRLYNTSCAAVEILGALRNEIPEWLDILTALADAVVACPAFRAHQKAKLIKKTGFNQSRYPDLPLSQKSTRTHTSPSGFSFSPPSLRENYVTVGHANLIDEGSPNPSHLLNLAPGAGDYDSDITSPSSSPKRPLHALPSASARLSRTTSAPNLFSPGLTYPAASASPKKKATAGSSKHRRVSSIAKQLGVDDELVKAVVEQLGLGGGGRV